MEWSILRYGIVESTNEIAKELAHHDASEGTAVIAVQQKSGKGRMGKTWHSPEGGLWLSVVLRPKFHPSEAGEMMGTCASSVAKALEKITGLKTEIKSPNDVLVNGKKIAGILVEESATATELQWMVVGIGINANFKITELPKYIQPQATTILDEMGTEVVLDLLLQRVLDNLENDYCKMIC